MKIEFGLKKDRKSVLALIVIAVICVGEVVLLSQLFTQPEPKDADLGEKHSMTFWLAKHEERNESLVPKSVVLTIYKNDVVLLTTVLNRTHDDYNPAYGLFGISELKVSKEYLCNIRITVESDMDEWCLERGFDTVVTNGPHWLDYWCGGPNLGTFVASSKTIMNWPDVSFEDEISLTIHLVDFPGLHTWG